MLTMKLENQRAEIDRKKRKKSLTKGGMGDIISKRVRKGVQKGSTGKEKC